MLSGAGVMSDPHHYRQLLMAIVGYSDKTIDEVNAEQEAAQAEREKQSKTRTARGVKPRVGEAVQPKKAELDKMAELLKFAKPMERPVNLDEPDPAS